jgi:hypothetical protein
MMAIKLRAGQVLVVQSASFCTWIVWLLQAAVGDGAVLLMHVHTAGSAADYGGPGRNLPQSASLHGSSAGARRPFLASGAFCASAGAL